MPTASELLGEVADVACNDQQALPDLEQIKHAYVVHVLEICQGNRSVAAKILGVDRKTLYRKLAQWGVEPPRARKEPAHAED